MTNIANQRDVTVPSYMPDVVEFIELRRRVDDLTKQKAAIQAKLSDLVEEIGEPDEKGHIWLRLPHEVGGYTSLQRQRKVSPSLDETTAESILKSKGLFERCYTMRPVLKEDEVMAAHFEGLLTEEEIDKMFPQKVTYAFIVSKA